MASVRTIEGVCMKMSGSTNISHMLRVKRRAVWFNIDIARLIADEIDNDILIKMRQLIDKEEAANDDN